MINNLIRTTNTILHSNKHNTFQYLRTYNFTNQNNNWHSTTILAIKQNNQIVIIGDGQVSLGSTRLKQKANKIRKINDHVYIGFAGSVADAMYLYDGLQKEFQNHPEQSLRACIEYAKQWRIGKQSRHLEASILVVDCWGYIIEMDGSGNVVMVEDSVRAIGSGGLYAECAAKGMLALLYDQQHLQQQHAYYIADKAMQIAADKCIYTSNYFVHKVMDIEQDRCQQEIQQIESNRSIFE